MAKNDENDIVEDVKNDVEDGISTAKDIKNIADNIKSLADKSGNRSSADKDSNESGDEPGGKKTDSAPSDNNTVNDANDSYTDSNGFTPQNNQEHGSINPDSDKTASDKNQNDGQSENSPEKPEGDTSEKEQLANKQKELTDPSSVTNQAAKEAAGTTAEGAAAAGASTGAEAATGAGAESAGAAAGEAGAEAAASGASGAATAGIGAIIAFVLNDFKKAVGDVTDFSESTDNGGIGLGKMIIGLFVLILVLLSIPSIYASYVSQVHSSGVESARDEQAYDIDTGRVEQTKQGQDSESGGIFSLIKKIGEKITTLIDALKHIVANLHFGLFTDGSDDQLLEPYDRSNAFSLGA